MKRERFYEISRERKKKKKNDSLRQNTRNAYVAFTYQPTTEWMQFSQVPAICNSGPSEPKNSVPQAEIGNILLAKSTAGSGRFIKYEPSIQNLRPSLHSPRIRLFSKGERCKGRLRLTVLLLSKSPPRIFYNFFPCSILERTSRRQ